MDLKKKKDEERVRSVACGSDKNAPLLENHNRTGNSVKEFHFEPSDIFFLLLYL